jgi:HKD family nuclease
MSKKSESQQPEGITNKNAHRKSYFYGHKTYSALIINDNQLWVNQNENRNNAEKYSTVAVARTAVSSLGKLIFCIDMDLRFERHGLVSPHRSGIG